ncbi:hypothetical protein [Embleya sp. NPDC059259]|uniref:hypothetical protein n=1 Tax=unclassified Embleya TaxID=2699296 RepID=UPI0036C3A32B
MANPARRALVVGVAGSPRDDPGVEAPDALPHLAYAPEYARRIRELLHTAYRYDPARPARDPADSAGALDEAVRAVLGGGPGLAVVHLLAHGQRGRSSGGLYVVGGDGDRVDTAVDQWLARLEDDEGDTAPTVLFLLDLCYAGDAARLHWQQLLRTPRRRAWVVAACQPGEPSYDGRLSHAVIEVLTGFRDGTLALDASFEFIPFERFCQEVAAAVARRAEGTYYRQEVATPLVPIGENLAHLAFFRNPRFDVRRHALRTGIDPTLIPLLDEAPQTRFVLDEAVDEPHFVGRAGGRDSSGDTDEPGAPGHFQGRSAEAARLAWWLAGADSALQVVTGKPGVGKSALLGVLVCAAHPELRLRTRSVWTTLGGAVPPLIDDLAVVHARRRTLSEITAALARQWELTDRSGARPGRLLAAELAERAEPPVLILDALDEAEGAEEVILSLLRPLLTTRRADGRSSCRIMIGCRREARLAELFALAERHGDVVDLDTVPRVALRTDLVDYINSLLFTDANRATAHNWANSHALAASMASALTEGAGADHEPPEWGEFLVARLYTRHLLGIRSIPATQAAARELGARIPRTLSGVLDLEPAQQHNPWIRATLTALAYAGGEGMPIDILRVAAPAFLASTRDAVGHPAAAVELALRRARFYLRCNADPLGRPLYRLFHQGLADALRADSEAADPDAVRALWAGLLGSVAAGADGRRDWAAAAPYLRRHAARHAREAGELDPLLADTDFLVHAEPAALAEELRSADRTPVGAWVYRTSYGAHHRAGPEERRQLLAVDAARHDAPELSEGFSRDLPWTVAWAAGRPLGGALRSTLTGLGGAVIGLAIVEVRGRACVLSGSTDGIVLLSDLATSTVLFDLRGHGNHPVRVAACRIDGRPHAVTGTADGLQVWDLSTGALVREWRGHATGVESLTVAPDASVLVTAHGKRLTWWDPVGGERIADTTLARSVGRLGLWDLDGRTHVVGCVRGEVWLWRLEARRIVFVRVLTRFSGDSDDRDFVTALSPVRGARRPTLLIGRADGSVAMVDPSDGDRVRGLGEGHIDGVTAVAMPDADGGWVVSAGSDGTVRVWDSASGRCASVLAGHTTAVPSLAGYADSAGLTVVSGGQLGTARVWRLAPEVADEGAALGVHRGHAQSGHPLRARSLAVTDAESGGFGISESADGTVCVWDPGTGLIRHTVDTGELHDIACFGMAGRPVVAGVRPEGGVAVWDARTGALCSDSDESVAGMAAVAGIVLEGKAHVLTGGWGGRVDLWDAGSGIRRRTLIPETVDGATTQCLAVLADPRTPLVAIGDAEGGVRLFAPTPDGPVRPRLLITHPAHINTLVFIDLPQGRALVGAGGDGVVRITTLDGALVRELVGHARPVLALVGILLEGRPHLLTGGADRTMRLWEPSSGRELYRYTFPDGVRSLEVTHSGDVLVATGNELLLLRPDRAVFDLARVPAPETPGPFRNNPLESR